VTERNGCCWFDGCLFIVRWVWLRQEGEVSESIDPRPNSKMFSPLAKEEPPVAGSLSEQQTNLGRDALL